MLTKIKREYSDILYNPTHFPGPLVWQIRQFWHPVRSDIFRWSLGLTDWTDSDILYNPTHFPGPLVWQTGSDILYSLTHFPGSLVWQIRQVLTSCTILHISLVPWFNRLDRFWHPVQSYTFPWFLGLTDRFWQPVQPDTFPWSLGLTD
jgi:hypothetical protein